VTLVQEKAGLEQRARYHKTEVRRHRAGLRLTMDRIAEITRRLEAMGITNGAAEKGDSRHGQRKETAS